MKTWNTKSGYKIAKLLSGRSNVFLLTNGITNILIDTSVYRNLNKLLKRLERISIDHINYIFLTHSHFDHSANAAALKDKYKAHVILHKDEVGFLQKGEIFLPNGSNTITKIVIKYLAPLAKPLFKKHPCICEVVFDSIFDLKEFGFDAYILHTPGHSPGSSCIIIDNEIAIVGDTMFGVFPWTVLPPFADNIKQIVCSWEKLLATNCSIFLPSHGWGKTRKQLQKGFDKRKKLLL